MKKVKLIPILIIMLFITSILTIGCSKNTELYRETDKFVESLQTTYKSYGIFGSTDHTVITKDGLYKITPIGRLINIRIEKYTTKGEYEKLKLDLKKHYKNDTRVNDVYICGGGTVMIDCRN